MKRLLLVDDDRDTREALAELLGQAYEITLACNGTEALAHSQVAVFDVILLDLSMPGMSGEQAVRNLRECGVTTPILLCSGSPDLKTVAKELKLPFLQKPYWLVDLLPLLNELANRPR